MTKTLSPGQRARLSDLGFTPRDVGRTFNRKTSVLPKDIPIPKTSDELAEFFGDGGRYKDILASRESLREFIAEYAQQQQGDGTELRRLVAEESQRVLAELLKDNGQDGSRDGIRRLNLDPQTRPKNMLASHKQATAYNPQALGALMDGKFSNVAEFIRTVWHRNETPEARDKRHEMKNAFGSVTPADGGFLVPETLRSQLLEIALEMSVVRPRATVVPMETARVPFPTIDATTNQGSVYGGMVGYWGEEGADLVDSSAKFGRVELDSKKLTGLSAVPNELLSDSLISFAALIERLWPEAVAFFEDVAFMTGSGAGEPLGFLGAGNPAGLAVAKESGQSADTIVVENIIKMYSRMLPNSLSRGIWVAAPNTIPELLTMALSVGTGGAPVMLANVAGPAPVTIFGRPLVISEKAKTLGDRGDIAFVDLSYYLVGDRQTMMLDSSTDFKFGSDKTTWRIIQRVDGRPWIKSPITPQNGSTDTLSPFVELAAR